jgi:phage terminase large subunit-like protein
MTPLAPLDRLRRLPAADRARVLARLSSRELAALRWTWRAWARPDVRDPSDPRTGAGQLPPAGDWQWWASIGGRGSGKTRAAAEWVNAEAMRLGRGCIIHLVGASIDDARATMVEGPSGLLACSPPWARPVFRASVEGGVLEWPSGAVGRVFGIDRPKKGRGPQCSRMWLDDIAAWGPNGKATLDQLLFGFRLMAPDGSGPRGVISTTPIDNDVIRWLLAGENGERKSDIVYSRSTTDDNRANLADSFFRKTLAEFAGTDLEQQERFGVFVSASSGKVFAGVDFSQAPIRVAALPPGLRAIAVWVDPATSSAAHSCEVGIVVVALDSKGHVYGVDDRSAVMSASEWPGVVIDCVERWSPIAPTHAGIEINKGGNMGPELIASADRIRRLQAGQSGASLLEIRTATARESKAQRGSPLVRLARSGFLHLLPGLTALERQLRDLDDTEGPKRDRADAFVWGVLDLTSGKAPTSSGTLEDMHALLELNRELAQPGSGGMPANGIMPSGLLYVPGWDNTPPNGGGRPYRGL